MGPEPRGVMPDWGLLEGALLGGGGGVRERSRDLHTSGLTLIVINGTLRKSCIFPLAERNEMMVRERRG
jgi:hypothetical protein